MNREYIKIAMKTLRVMTGKTGIEFAEIIGRPISSIKSIEAGRRPLSSTTLASIVTQFGVCPDSFLNGVLICIVDNTQYSPESLVKWEALNHKDRLTIVSKIFDKVVKEQNTIEKKLAFICFLKVESK